MFEISKEFKFEMAHKLSHSYTKKCQHIHGHSYRLLLKITAFELDDENVVVDFTRIKELISPIVEMLDHSFMIHKDDPYYDLFVDEKLRGENQWPLIIAPLNPTAEYLAEIIANTAFILLYEQFNVEAVVYETASSYASYATYEYSYDDFKTIRDLEFLRYDKVNIKEGGVYKIWDEIVEFKNRKELK